VGLTRSRRAGHAGELLDLVALTPDGLAVLADGTMLRALETRAVNPLVMDAARVEQLARQLHAVNSRVPAGQSLQFVVQSAPLALTQLLTRERGYCEHAATAAEAAGRDGSAEAIRRHGFAQAHSLLTHVPAMAATSVRFLVLCPWRPEQPLLRRRRSERDAVRTVDARTLAKQAQRASRYSDEIAAALRACELTSRRLDGRELLDVLWARFSPGLADAGKLPPSLSVPGVCGALEAAGDEERARARAARLQAAICQQPIRHSGPTALLFGETAGDADGADGEPRGASVEQTYALTTAPEHTWLGWVMHLMQASIPWTLSIHVHGTDRHRERARQRRRYKRLYGLNRGSELRGRLVDPEQHEREQEAAEVNTALATHAGSTVQHVSVYLSLRDVERDDAEELLQRIADEGEALGKEVKGTTDAHLDGCRFVQRDAWRSTLPLGRDYLRRTRRYLSLNVADTLPLVSTGCGSPPSPTWIPVGFGAVGRTLEGLDPFDPAHPNHVTLVCGQGGAGKTMLVILLLSRSIAKGATGTVIERGGHFATLAQANPDAALLQLGAGPRAHTLNPWDGAGDDRKVAFLLALHDLLIGDQTGLDDGSLGVKKRSLLSLAIRAVYQRCAATGERPRERLLQEELHKRHVAAKADGAAELAADYQTLELSLANYVGDGPAAWLADRPTTIPDDPALDVWDTQFIPESESAAALFVICEATLRRVKARRACYLAGERDGRPWDGRSFLVIDEAWKLLERRSTGRWINEHALRSRHIATWFVAISQRLDHFATPEGKALTSQAPIKVFLRNGADELPYLQQAVGLSDEEAHAIGALTTSKREFSTAYLINGNRGRGTLTISVSDLEYWLATSDPIGDEPLRRDALRQSGGDVWRALKLLADPAWHAKHRQREHRLRRRHDPPGRRTAAGARARDRRQAETPA
jgi:hypothetical protein